MSSESSNKNEEERARAPFGPPDCIWKEMSPGSPLPDTAVSAGGTLNGEPIYIGRVRHNNTLLVGTAVPSKGVCLFFSNDSVESSTSYEILDLFEGCSNQLEFRKLDLDSRLVLKVGNDNKELLCVGRYVIGEDTYIGWITPSTKSLFIPVSSELGSPKVEEDYEVLIHKFLDRLAICKPCPPCRRGKCD